MRARPILIAGTRCVTCFLFPQIHKFHACKSMDCQCRCVQELFTPGKHESPKWSEIGIKESKGLKLPATYTQYMYYLAHVKSGRAYREGWTPAFLR